jgi:hypothetical protein
MTIHRAIFSLGEDKDLGFENVAFGVELWSGGEGISRPFDPVSSDIGVFDYRKVELIYECTAFRQQDPLVRCTSFAEVNASYAGIS